MVVTRVGRLQEWSQGELWLVTTKRKVQYTLTLEKAALLENLRQQSNLVHQERKELRYIDDKDITTKFIGLSFMKTC